MKFFFLGVDIARLLCYPLHTDILGYPRMDPVGDISHQFSATHAIISLLSALKDVTVSLLPTLLKQTVHQNSSTIKTHFYF